MTRQRMLTRPQGKSTNVDSNVMPEHTRVNKKRTAVASGKKAPANWRGWNNKGTLRFNDLCKKVKDNGKEFPTIDKGIVAAVEPEENQQRQKSAGKS